jgi:hypothetical protein
MEEHAEELVPRRVKQGGVEHGVHGRGAIEQ